MNPTIDLKGEHAAFTIILGAMKKLAFDIRNNKVTGLLRIEQIIDFLHIYTDHCHYVKEEKSLFPALLAFDIPWIIKMINQLIKEHMTARGYIDELNDKLRGYLSGQKRSLESMSDCLIKFVTLEEYHIKTEENIVLPLCEKMLSKQKLMMISSDFKTIQDNEVGHVKCIEYFKLLSNLYSESHSPVETSLQS